MVLSVSHVTVAGGYLNSISAPSVSMLTIPLEGLDGEGPDLAAASVL